MTWNGIYNKSGLPSCRALFLLSTMAMTLIVVCLCPVSGQTIDQGMVVMEINKWDLKPCEPFTVKCSYYDNSRNNPSGALIFPMFVPLNEKKSVELKSGSNLLIEPSGKIPVNDPGLIKSWDVTPQISGECKIVLYVNIKGKDPLKRESPYISVNCDELA